MRIDRPKGGGDFSGERFVYAPSEMEVELEHVHRYVVAAEFCNDRKVLDAASGSGYGSAILGQTAQQVVGLEIDAESVRHATETYGSDHVTFRAGNVMDTGLPDEAFDVIVSVETLEHVDNHQMMLREFSRVLKPDGILIISTPDKPVYNRHLTEPNPFHVSELARDEFFRLLRSFFPTVEFYGQRAVFGSLLAKASDDWRALMSFRRDGDTGLVQARNIYDEAMYIVAVCGKGAVPRLSSSLYEGTIPQNALSSLIGGLADRDRAIAELAGGKNGEAVSVVVKALLDRLTALEIERQQGAAATVEKNVGKYIFDLGNRIDQSARIVVDERATLDQRLRALQLSISHASSENSTLFNSKVKDLETLLLTMNMRVSQIREEIAHLGASAKAQEIGTTRQQMQGETAEYDAMRRVMDELQRENENLRAQYQAIIASHSWIITRPFRVLKRLFFGR